MKSNPDIMNRFGFILLLVLLSNSSILAGNITLKGKAPEYAGKTISLKTYADYLTKKEKVITKMQVDSTGAFTATFSSKQAIYTFMDLGAYRGYIVLEPGKTYHLKLPPKKQQSRRERLNPYYKPQAVYLKIKQPDSMDVNLRIEQFDYEFNGFLANVTMRKFKRKPLNDVDSLMQVLDDKYAGTENDYFKRHKFYRFAYMKNALFDRKAIESLKQDFAGKIVAYNHPVYNEVFSGVTADYLKALINQGKFNIPNSNYYTVKGMVAYINRAKLFRNDSLREYFILNALYEGYHEDYFHFKSVHYVTDSLSKHGITPYIRKASGRIKNEVMKLRENYPAPTFELPDQDGITASLDLFRGKFILLHFYSSASYAAVKELPLLKKLHEKFQDDLAIVTISTDKNFQKVLKQAKNHEYDWTFLHYQNSSHILEKYEVLAYPTYYLISPDGKLLLSPAPAPGNELESRLVKRIVKHNREQLRQQYRNKSNTQNPR